MEPRGVRLVLAGDPGGVDRSWARSAGGGPNGLIYQTCSVVDVLRPYRAEIGASHLQWNNGPGNRRRDRQPRPDPRACRLLPGRGAASSPRPMTSPAAERGARTEAARWWRAVLAERVSG